MDGLLIACQAFPTILYVKEVKGSRKAKKCIDFSYTNTDVTNKEIYSVGQTINANN